MRSTVSISSAVATHRTRLKHPITTRALALAIGMMSTGVLCATDAAAAILSAKRGLGDVGANYSNLQVTGSGWYYTWGTGPANPGTFDANHYPMFWGWTGQSTINSTLAAEPTYILGYNEPERGDQANMPVGDAIANWTTISNSTVNYNAANGTDIKLVSPAVADTGGAGGGQQWLANFMSQANTNGLKVDAVAFHWYGVSNPNNPSGAASSFLSRVDSYHNSYGKPVFITEFAIHDWGGAYTDEAIIEANRQFLNIVIPGLESRSYVAGYAWYHWFNDAHLYDSNYEPTVMAYDYIGAVQTGQTSDIGGTNLGEHIAYLNGGTLTMTSSAGTIKFLHALYDPNASDNSSDISGTLDWAPSNWTKIQAGATLRKSGTNTISLTAGTVTNNGVLEVADGVLRLGVSPGGTGSILIPSTGGATGSTARLELTGNITVDDPIIFAQRNDPGGSDGIRNVSGNNALLGPMTIIVGGAAARVRSDAGQLTLGPITTDATSARNLYLQGAGNGIVSGGISDNASNVNGKINLTKEGSGTWTLAGANTHTGTTTVNAGTLAFGASQSNIGSVTVANSGALRVQAAGPASTTLTSSSLSLGTTGPTSLTFDFNSLDTTAPLISTGSFTANGSVNVTLQNAGALLAGTHALIGYTSFAGTGTFPGSPFTLGPRSTGTLVNNGTSALNLNVTADRPVWTGLDNGNWVAGVTGLNKNWKLQTATSATDYIQGDNVLFDDTAAGGTTVSISISGGNVSPAAANFNNSAKNYTVTSGGGFGIAGAGSVVKNGTGTLTLATANSYTGSTWINGGTVSISANNNLGDNAAPVMLNGGTLRTTAGITNTHAFTVGASGGTINVTTSGQYFFNTPDTLRGSGPLTVTGNGTLTQNVGNLRLAQANSYSGNLTAQSGGIVEYGTGGAVAAGATFAIGNQGELALQGGVATSLPNNITVTGGTNTTLSFENGTAGTYAGNITLNASAIIGLRDWYNWGTVRGGAISGTISGSGGLTVFSGTSATTAGTLTLSGYNTFAGNVIVNRATVVADANNNVTNPTSSALGNPQLARTITINNGGTLRLAGADTFGGATSTVASSLIINTGGTVTNGGDNFNTLGPVQLNGGTLTGTGGAVAGYQMYNLRGTVTVGGTAASTISGSGANSGYHLAAPTTFNVANVVTGNDLTVTGILIDQDATHTGAGSLTKTGAGTMVLGGANTFTGGVNVTAGELVASYTIIANPITGALGNSTVAGRTITVGSGTTLRLAVNDVFGNQAATAANLPALNVSGTMMTNRYNQIGAITLSAATLTSANTTESGNFQSYQFLGDVTVTGSAPSSMTSTSPANFNGNHLNTTTTFNVADVTGNANDDLTVAVPLLNRSNNYGNTPGGLVKSGAGTMLITATPTYTGSTAVGAGRLRLGTSLTTSGAVTVTGGTLEIGSGGGANRVIKTPSVSVSGGGKIDVRDNKLITQSALGSWNGSDYTGVTGLVQSGRGDGSWNGSGIVTSMTDATTGVLTTVAVASAQELGNVGGTFAGQLVGASDVLVMYTWGGDADLNGELNGDDYFFIDSNAVNNGAVFGFHQGDFDYNGTIDGDDYFIIDSNITFAQGSPPFPTSGGAGGLAAIPEPTCGAAAVGLLLAFTRKRMRS